MENLDNRISVNRDVIPPGSLPTGNPECARFIAAPRKIYEKRTNRSHVSIESIWLLLASGSGKFVSPPDSRSLEIGGSSQLARSRRFDYIFPAGRFDRILESWGKDGNGVERSRDLPPLGPELMEYPEETESWWQSWFDACNSSRESKLWTFSPPPRVFMFHSKNDNLDRWRYFSFTFAIIL